MNFTVENAAKVLRGEKTMTCRRTCKYKVGRTYAVCPGRGKKAVGRIEVLDIRYFKRAIGAVFRKHLAEMEGFPSIAAWQREYVRLCGAGSLEEPCYRIEFRFVEN